MSSKLKKLLFVDDDSDIVNLAKYCLSSFEDVEILYITSGEEAIRQLPDFKPDLVVMDLMMSGISGLDVLRAMRKIPATQNLPVIFITAKSDQSELDTHQQLGIIGIINKPFDALLFADKIKNLWNNH